MNCIDFLFKENINPIIPRTGHINIVLMSKGFNSVNLFNKFIGKIYDITKTTIQSGIVCFSKLILSIQLAQQY